MILFSPLKAGGLARVVLLVALLAIGLGLRPGTVWASHIRAGDIQAKTDTTANPNPRRVFFKMILYLDITRGPNPVDQPDATIFFGDGTSSCKGGVLRSVKRAIAGNTDTNVNTYLFEHTYPSAGTFKVSFIGENRNAGVLNMTQSDNQSFYISTTITLDPALGLNHSPVLTAPAIDKAGVGQVFLHNPAGYDADGDSLAFKLRTCQQVPAGVDGTVGGAPCTGQGAGPGNNQPAPVVCTNYRYPNDPAVAANAVQVAYGGVPTGVPGAPAIFVQDVNTGQITWNAPIAAGLYNVAMVVEEWRRTPLGRRNIGEVIRDMQITVVATTNLRPIITIPPDICVIAGQRVNGTVTAVDGGTGGQQSPINLFAYSGILPPATFNQTQTGPPQASGNFSWLTDCSNVARLPYQVVFKAQDNPTGTPTTNPVLIDEKTWRITVVGPPPQNLRATPTASGGINSVVLSWNSYICTNASQIYIYRKIDKSNFEPGPCDTGIPASAGYTRIGSVAANATTFTDNNVSANGTVLGLERGKTYCYRIYAEFPLPAGGASIASQEACAFIGGRSAMLTNVDVESTALTTGQVTVRWTQPRTPDGSAFGGTPTYVLSRAEGLTPAAAAFAPVRAPFTSLTDTSYVDSGLNTQDKQYTYKLEFVRTFAPGAGTTITEASPTASSVRTSAVPADLTGTRATVSWTYNVPWDNTAQPTVVFRRTGGTGPYTRIGTAASTATGGTYTDADPSLRKGETYCYYVQTNGRYAGFAFLSTLLNKSQERCLVLSSPPCRPVLALAATNCDSLAGLAAFPGPGQRYANRLSWRAGGTPAGCDAAAAGYRLYYRPGAAGAFVLLASLPGTQTGYLHQDLAFSGGCYALLAVGASGALSDTSNVACQDNCVFFKLPNIFTPNGDGQNAVFRPKTSSPVRRVRFQAFNRWGVKVFENTTTGADAVLINWDGGGPAGEAAGAGRTVSDGVYFYLAQVEFADAAGTKRTYKGWVEIVR